MPLRRDAAVQLPCGDIGSQPACQLDVGNQTALHQVRHRHRHAGQQQAGHGQDNFIRHGVPSVMMGVAPEPGTPEVKIFKDWLTQRYHAPSDDLNQPVDLATAGKFETVMTALALKVAKEIVVKFIEVGRVSPTSFADTFTMVIDTLRQSLKAGGKG